MGPGSENISNRASVSMTARARIKQPPIHTLTQKTTPTGCQEHLDQFTTWHCKPQQCTRRAGGLQRPDHRSETSSRDCSEVLESDTNIVKHASLSMTACVRINTVTPKQHVNDTQRAPRTRDDLPPGNAVHGDTF